jgi:hypothetical protein
MLYSMLYLILYSINADRLYVALLENSLPSLLNALLT